MKRLGLSIMVGAVALLMCMPLVACNAKASETGYDFAWFPNNSYNYGGSMSISYTHWDQSTFSINLYDPSNDLRQTWSPSRNPDNIGTVTYSNLNELGTWRLTWVSTTSGSGQDTATVITTTTTITAPYAGSFDDVLVNNYLDVNTQPLATASNGKFIMDIDATSAAANANGLVTGGFNSITYTASSSHTATFTFNWHYNFYVHLMSIVSNGQMSYYARTYYSVYDNTAGQWVFQNVYETEYSRSLGGAQNWYTTYNADKSAGNSASVVAGHQYTISTWVDVYVSATHATSSVDMDGTHYAQLNSVTIT